MKKKTPDQKDHNVTAEGINRRDFLKYSALAAAGSALTPGMAKAGKAQHLPDIGFDREVYSACSLCQTRCTTIVQVKDGRVVNVYGRPGNEWTGGGMCPKGKALVELTYSPDRQLYPMLREGTTWKRISYRQAIEIAAEKMLELKKKYPKDFGHRLAMFAPLWESREAELAAEATLHLSGFPNIYHSGDTCISNTGIALANCLGSAITETTLDELPNAELAVLFGANIAETYPPCARWIKMAQDKGVKIVYIDPRWTNTCVFSDIFLRPRPGTDGALILGLINYLISENLYDRDFVASSVNGFEMLVESVKPYTLDKVSNITWIPKGDIRKLAEILGRSRRTIFWMGGGLSRYTNAIQTGRALVALQAVTGNLAGKGKGILAVQAGKPGGDEKFSETYTSHDMIYHLGFRKMLYAMKKGKVNVLLLTSSFRRYPDSNDLREAIKKVDFVIHRGFFMNEEAKLSHLFIPGVMNFESEGSAYGLQRQIVWRDRVIEPLGETVSEFQFYRDLGRLVCGDAFPPVETTEDMYILMQKTDPSWAGLTLERVKASPSGIIWPCYSTDGPDGRGTLYKDGRFWTKDGKVELRVPALGNFEWEEPQGSPWDKKKGDPKKFPLIFTQGKVVQHWQQSITSWSRYMAQFSDGNVANINPVTANELGLAKGDRAWLETEVGRLQVKINITEGVQPGVVWTPSHPDPATNVAGNAGQTVNSIVPGYWDKLAAQFNGFGCSLTKA